MADFWQRHTPQFAPPVWWGDPQMRSYCQEQAACDPILAQNAWREQMDRLERAAQRNHEQMNALPTLGPNQIAWCKEHLRGFSMEGT